MQTKITFIKPNRGIVRRIGKVDKNAIDKEFSKLLEDVVSDSKCIKIWAYDDAPIKYKRLYGDDVDWVAFIPLWIFRKGYCLDFLGEGTPFACCHVEKRKVEGGEVWFGCHS